MFTGLVEDTGVVTSVVPRGTGIELGIRTAIPLDEVEIGASIAVNGVCLTAETLRSDVFTATAGRETLQLTTIGSLRVGDRVHLERALRVGDRLGGHLVQGHVDGTGRYLSIEQRSESWVLWLEAPPELVRYIAPKGSVTLDGVSLTVNEMSGPRFRVNIVPHTATVTALTSHRAGDGVNIEVDVLAKYVERLLGDRAGGGLSLELLQRTGLAT